MRGRILLAVSGIGMGHIARARVLGRYLEGYGYKVDYIAPPPLGRYLGEYGIAPHPVSYSLESYFPVVERHYSASGTGRITLRMMLEEARIARRNAETLDKAVDYSGYDAVVSDESWELFYSRKLAQAEATILVTDFLYYPYRRDTILEALSFNRFMARRLSMFRHLVFAGLPGKYCRGRWPPVIGKRQSERVDRVIQAGPIPPATRDEVLPREEARRLLGVEDDRLVLMAPGGTEAGLRILIEASRSVAEAGYTPVWPPPKPSGSPGIEIPSSMKYKIPLLVRGFDGAVALAGLLTIAILVAEGIPSIVIPLPGHFEQEENASEASRTYPWIAKLNAGNAGLAGRILDRLSRKPIGTGDEGVYHNVAKAAGYIHAAVQNSRVGG